ncbi:Clp protease N-terminal domain-containing protein [Acidicapsa acidisoli]|uniref:Clp protease N-terminal domain-containing protein n=1 Tax=Acidicapsa acidisoli TaxID=1615681 RepID=UPI0021E09E3A|nr:Clp protease N-terminal domain-containing protein [Acidicapsa acidisoli]
MFERYNEKARRVIFFARYEASEFGSPYIETEHLLLGLLRENKGVFTLILGLNLSEEEIRAAISELTTKRQKIATSIDLPLSDEALRILAYSAEEAERLRNKHIGPEHLLLGILREEKCLAARILRDRGIQLKKARSLIETGEKELAATRASDADAVVQGLATGHSIGIQILEAGSSDIQLRLPGRSRVPRIGESIRIRDGENAHHSYRIQDVVWELEPDHGNPGASFLKEVTLRVVKENAD